MKTVYDQGVPNSPGSHILENVLVDVIDSYDRVVICIDALDESPDDEDSDSRAQLLNGLLRLADKTRPNLQLFVTSRDSRDIRNTMNDIEAKPFPIDWRATNRDIGAYVNAELHSDRKLRNLGEGIKVEIRDCLTQKADGM